MGALSRQHIISARGDVIHKREVAGRGSGYSGDMRNPRKTFCPNTVRSVAHHREEGDCCGIKKPQVTLQGHLVCPLQAKALRTLSNSMTRQPERVHTFQNHSNIMNSAAKKLFLGLNIIPHAVANLLCFCFLFSSPKR